MLDPYDYNDLREDAAPKDFKKCSWCKRKGRYRHITYVGTIRYVYERCRYCGSDTIIEPQGV